MQEPYLPATCVIEGQVWLGSARDAFSESFLRANNIKCIINVAAEVPPPPTPVETYLKIEAQDVLGYYILELHSAYVSQCLAEQLALKRPTLIHCALGKNRSATLLADFLAKIVPIPVDQIMHWLKSLRPIVFSNSSFVDQLLRSHGPRQIYYHEMYS